MEGIPSNSSDYGTPGGPGGYGLKLPDIKIIDIDPEYFKKYIVPLLKTNHIQQNPFLSRYSLYNVILSFMGIVNYGCVRDSDPSGVAKFKEYFLLNIGKENASLDILNAITQCIDLIDHSTLQNRTVVTSKFYCVLRSQTLDGKNCSSEYLFPCYRFSLTTEALFKKEETYQGADQVIRLVKNLFLYAQEEFHTVYHQEQGFFSINKHNNMYPSAPMPPHGSVEYDLDIFHQVWLFFYQHSRSRHEPSSLSGFLCNIGAIANSLDSSRLRLKNWQEREDTVTCLMNRSDNFR